MAATAAVPSSEWACADLAEPDVLRRALAEALVGVRRAHVSVALRCGDRAASATRGERDDEPALIRQPLGCLTKLVTATLASAAVRGGCFAFDDEAANLLGASARALRGVTMRHLLDHTHGWDDSLFPAPRQYGGRLDAAELVARVERLPRVAGPGAIYNYGNLGAWLVAAVLERVHERSYAALVRNEILAPLDAACADGPWCAATGGGLALTAHEVAEFLVHAARLRHESWPANLGSAARGAITPLPGWNPLERGVHLGWKLSGRGWLGHQSAWPGASAYVRVHPERRLALVVLARTSSAAVVAARLFGKRFPDLFDLRPPSRSPAGVPDDALRCQATYQHAAHVVSIETHSERLRLAARARNRCGGRGGAVIATLRHAAGGVYFAEPTNELVPYAQLVAAPDGAAPLLWNGRHVLRRLEAKR